MDDNDAEVDGASLVISSARAADQAIQHLCWTRLTQPSMTPAEVDAVLAHLADVAAALPRAARQLGDILAQAKEDHVLGMDGLTQIEDPELAIDTAQLHLDPIREAALSLYRLLDAAHNETAHIGVTDRLAKHTEVQAQDITPLVPRPENRDPPPMGGGGPARAFNGDVDGRRVESNDGESPRVSDPARWPPAHRRWHDAPMRSRSAPTTGSAM